MPSGDQAHDREHATQKFEQAQRELERRHLDRAEELGREALEFDTSYHEVRLWLADVYLMLNEPQRASRVLQDLLYMDRENEQAWAKLREVDPASAERLERLSHIAPDPFVSSRRAEDLSDDFADLEEVTPDKPMTEAEFFSGEEGHPELFEDMALEEESQGPPEELDERGAAPWEYEQDREYLARWMQEDVVRRLVHSLRDLWKDLEALRPVTDMCAHLEKERHPEIVETSHHCAQCLHLHDAELMVFAERCMHPVPVQDDPPKLAVPTGLIRGMHGAELCFQIGRELGYVRSGYLAPLQIASVIADRPTRLVGDVATVLRELLHDLLASIEMGIKRDERQRLAKLAHAWQQRATLTADRAGWLCCGDAEAVCVAIAKTTARSVEEASRITLAGFLEQFKGKDPASLAAIPVTETPDRSVNYAAYRIQMLRWWARTPEAEALRQEICG